MWLHWVAAIAFALPILAVILDQFTKNHLGVPGMNMFKSWTFTVFGKSFTIPAYFFPSTSNPYVDELLGRNDLIHGAIGTTFGYALMFYHLPWYLTALVSIYLFLIVEIHEHDVRWDNTLMHTLGTAMAIAVQLMWPFLF